MTMLHCIRLCFIIRRTGDIRYNLAHSKGRNKWILKKILEDKDYSHLNTLLDDVITLRQTPTRLDIHNFEQPDNIPKTLQNQNDHPSKKYLMHTLHDLIDIHRVVNNVLS